LTELPSPDADRSRVGYCALPNTRQPIPIEEEIPMKKYRLLAAATVAIAGSVAMAGCSSARGATDSNGVTTLRYQGAANSVTLPEVAQALGFFGTKIKLQWVGDTISGPQDIQSAATNQTDFGEAFTGAVVKLEEAGAQVTAVVTAYGTDAKTNETLFVKASSKIRTARDLIGKKIAVNTLGANSEAFIDTYLEHSGLSAAQIKQVQLVVLPPNNTEEAIRKGEVEAGILTGVLTDHAVAAGGLRELTSDYQQFGAYNGGQYVLRNDFIKSQPAAARAFVTGIAKAIEWERDTPRAEVIAEFAKIINGRHRNESTTNLKYWKSVGVAARDGVISANDFALWQKWLASSGIVSGALTPSKYYTNSLNPFASGASS
jgi:ABC-type nitrate/sulfonate/bicarbonate transport system substrate-binding protein